MRLEEYKEKLIAGNYESNYHQLDSLSVEEVSKMILEVLQSAMASSESGAFGSASDLFTQLVLRRSQPSDTEIRFGRSYRAGEQRAIVEQLELALEHSVFWIRWNTITTLGRIGSVDSIDKMVATFNRAINNDPGIIARLVGEVRWIIGTTPDPERFANVYRGLLEQLVYSDSYMNRWAAVEIIQSSPDTEPRDLVEQLKADSHPLVRLQATSPDEANKQRVSFEMVTVNFQSPNGHAVTDIDRFVTKWLKDNT